MPEPPAASIVIPTRGRPEYLDVALASVAQQATRAGAEVLVVSDGTDPLTASVAERHRARLLELPERPGLNAARNAGARAARSELTVFIDDDVEAPPGWLCALLEGVDRAPDRDVFGGPIHARLDRGGPRACGREPAPITTLDLGPEDRDVPLVWGANMAVRRRAFEQAGGFDEALAGAGDEEEWQRRYASRGGRVRYLARAGLDHWRTAGDSTLRALCRSGYSRGRSARRYDVRKGTAPGSAGELRTLAGCAWHVVRRRCGVGVVLGAHSAGRLREALAGALAIGAAAPAPAGRGASAPRAEDFLSQTSGQVTGARAITRATALDLLHDAAALGRGEPWRIRRAARRLPRRRVLALAIERTELPNLLAAAREELLRSRHDVSFASAPAGGRGKFQNLNALLAANPPRGHDWLLVVDDDVALPRGFLDAFIFLAERFQLCLAQPAHRWRSHAAWPVTRRRATSVVRETAFVEIGPVLAFHAATFGVLLPFPELRAGWGLDAHWSALAREQGWRLGVLDATPIRHSSRQIASAYDRLGAIDEAREFLRGRAYTRASEAQRTLAAHRSW